MPALPTDRISYDYDLGGVTLTVVRRHVGTAYARNGNVGNPTQYYRWSCLIDGDAVPGDHATRADAYEHGRARILGIPYVNDDRRRRWVNVRNFNVVRAEMQANYRGRTAA